MVLEVGNFVGEAVGKRVLAAFEETGVEKARDVARGDRPVADAALVRLDLDKGLEPSGITRLVNVYGDERRVTKGTVRTILGRIDKAAAGTKP